MKTWMKAGILFFGAGLSAGACEAADVPTAAESVIQQAARTTEDQQAMLAYYKYSRDTEISEKARPLVVREKKAESVDPELSFEVKEIRVTPSKLLTDEEIEKAVHFKGAGVSNVAELRAMVDRLNALYVAKKIPTAQAVLPPQTIKDGVVYIRLIEGTFGKLEISGNHRIETETIAHRIRAATGELVDVDRLQDDLRVYNSTNVYQIRAELVPGEEEGTSDLRLVLEEKENPVTTFIFTDNAGQYDSGRYRIGFYTEYRGIGGHDAALAISPIWTRGIWGGSVMYDMPIGLKGTRIAISYGRNVVNIIRGTFADQNMKAKSNDVSLTISHPLNVTMLTKTDLFLELHKKWSDTEYSGIGIADDDTKTMKLGLMHRKFDDHGMWFAMLSATGYESDDAFRGREKNGSYFNGYLMRRQNISDDRYLMVRLSGQYTARKELPTTERFTMGGMGSVRGFRDSTLTGDIGWYAGIEYGFPLSVDHKTWRGFTFLDHGVAYSEYSVQTTKEHITSMGFGVEFNKGGWYGKVALGFPISDSGKIANDSVTRIHFYLQRTI